MTTGGFLVSCFCRSECRQCWRGDSRGFLLLFISSCWDVFSVWCKALVVPRHQGGGSGGLRRAPSVISLPVSSTPPQLHNTEESSISLSYIQDTGTPIYKHFCMSRAWNSLCFIETKTMAYLRLSCICCFSSAFWPTSQMFCRSWAVL